MENKVKREVNQFQRAYFGWIVLCQVAKNRRPIRYKEFGDRIRVHHRAVRFVLSVIQEYCITAQLPPITILVGNSEGLPGDGFVAWDIDNIQEGFDIVYNEDWENKENPFAFAVDGVTEVSVVSSILDTAPDLQEIYSKVKVRGMIQQLFRKALLRAYDSKCAICQTDIPVILQAAHIIPWSRASKVQRLDVRNGILLCANHHCLYDHNFIKINTDYTLTAPGIDMNFTNIILPADIRYAPGQEYINIRQSLIAEKDGNTKKLI